KELNLSSTFEAIPKSINKNDSSIIWVNENIAKPLEKTFLINNEICTAEITSAMIKNKDGEFQSIFPSLREDRIEYAIISLASKQIVDLDTDKKNNRVFILRTSYYQVQKEIVEAINRREGKNLKPSSSPYNVSDIKKALEVLKITSIRVNNKNGKKQYLFNRIKDMYLEDKKVVIELGSMVADYINVGDWRATDKDSILASKGAYELKMRVLLNMNFRYATENSVYNPSLDFLIEKLGISKDTNKRTALQMVVRILEKMQEVEKIEVEKKYSGKKLENAIFKIYPSKEFVSVMINNNKLTKRTKDNEYALENEKDIFVKPLKSEFNTELEYKEAKQKYEQKKIKKIQTKMKGKFN
ncbi:hypothetical protein AZO1586R_1825, partial [Bathymodiolus azoricus thioautotrophic gill symbiont]